MQCASPSIRCLCKNVWQVQTSRVNWSFCIIFQQSSNTIKFIIFNTLFCAAQTLHHVIRQIDRYIRRFLSIPFNRFMSINDVHIARAHIREKVWVAYVYHEFKVYYSNWICGRFAIFFFGFDTWNGCFRNTFRRCENMLTINVIYAYKVSNEKFSFINLYLYLLLLLYTQLLIRSGS